MMARPETRAQHRASDVADEYHERGRDRLADLVRANLLDDDLWCWLTVATDRASGMSHQRWRELGGDVDSPHVPEDELRDHLSSVELQLADALELRERQLIDEALEEVDADD